MDVVTNNFAVTNLHLKQRFEKNTDITNYIPIILS